ncbi:MAG: peptidoglycan DD-metalloendopeptidase family protein [Chitinophagales bacterium]
MKRNKNKIKHMLSMVLLAGSFSAFSQEVHIVDDGNKDLQCVTEEEYQEFMKPLLDYKIQKLEAEGKIQPKSGAKTGGGSVVPLAWPLRMADDYRENSGVYSYWYVSNFADLDHDEGDRLDWLCFTGSAAKNYDQHNGADIVPFPFPWQMMDDESVDVIAAADGEVIHIFDANTFDRNCASPHSFVSEPFNGGYYGNFVALRHSDYSITVYAHIKNGTVADLEDGDQVVAGQFLGKIGSSGNSTAPHLHFEVRPTESSTYIEPWYDSEGCNDDVTESQWIDQVPYYEPQVIRVSTHDAIPVFKSCSEYEAGENEAINTSNHFSSVTTVYIGVSLRDYLIGDDLYVEIINSSGTLMESFSHIALTDYEAETIYFSESTFGYATGAYKIKVTHDGKSYYHFFTVNCPASLTLSGAQSGVKGYISGGSVTSTATISGSSTNDILYQGETHVQLNVGFQATVNCEFRAEVDDCTLGGVKEAEIPEEGTSDAIKIFPNPNFGIFTLQYKTDGFSDIQYVVRNMMGDVVFESNQYNDVNTISETVNLSDLAKGVYMLEVRNADAITTEKIVIQ